MLSRSRARKEGFYKKRSSLSYAVVAIVGLVLVGFGLHTLRGWYAVRHGGVPSPHGIATVSVARPSEQPVPAGYSVPANQPLSISLPSIHTSGFIQQVSITKGKQMVAPSNINMAGWYTGGAKPGNTGLSIIDGHVNGAYTRGIFHNLAQLLPGATFTVTYGDHSTRSFQVVSTHTYSVEAAGAALFTHNSAISRQLNLITCGGSYLKASKSYSGRVIAVAQAI